MSELAASKNLLDNVNGPLRTDFSDTNGKQPIQKRIIRRGGFETWQRAEIVARIVPHTGESHVDQDAVVGFESDAQIELECPVGPCSDPVAAAGCA